MNKKYILAFSIGFILFTSLGFLLMDNESDEEFCYNIIDEKIEVYHGESAIDIIDRYEKSNYFNGYKLSVSKKCILNSELQHLNEKE